MRNASQQLAQCGQLFGLMQAFLRLAQLVAGIVQIGDVGRHAADPVDLAIWSRNGKIVLRITTSRPRALWWYSRVTGNPVAKSSCCACRDTSVPSPVSKVSAVRCGRSAWVKP